MAVNVNDDVKECIKTLVDMVSKEMEVFNPLKCLQTHTIVTASNTNKRQFCLELSSDDESTDSSSSDTSDSSSSYLSDSSDEKPIIDRQLTEKNKSDGNATISQVESIFKELLLQDEESTDKNKDVLQSITKLEPVGKISKVIEESLVIVTALENVPALDLGSYLFLQNRKVFGKILETFGPVILPRYVVTIKETKPETEIDQLVYFAPGGSSITSFILASQLQGKAGSDASWLDDKEPPIECLDYSDDEEERNAKRDKRKRKTKPTAPYLGAMQQPQQQHYSNSYPESWHNVSTCFQNSSVHGAFHSPAQGVRNSGVIRPTPNFYPNQRQFLPHSNMSHQTRMPMWMPRNGNFGPPTQSFFYPNFNPSRQPFSGD